MVDAGDGPYLSFAESGLDVEPPEPAPPDLSGYWANCPAERLGEQVAAKANKRDQTSLSAPWRMNMLNAYYNYYGLSLDGVSPSASYVTRSGEQGERVEVRINQARALASSKRQIVVGPKVSWSCTAANSDYRSMADTVLGAKLLEVYWKERSVERLCVDAVEGAIFLGEDFLFTPWDKSLGDDVMAVGGQAVKTGDVAYLSVPTWDVLRDATARSWDELNEVIVRRWRNKYDVAAEHPEQAEHILNFSTQLTLAGGMTGLPEESDLIPVLYFFHKRTPAVPRGREAVVVGDVVVWESEEGLSYKTIPLHRMACGDLKGTPWPYTSFWEVLGIQQLSDSIASDLATNISTFAGGVISAEEGSALPIERIAAGPTVIYRKGGSAPPVAVQMPQAPKEAFTFAGSLKSDQRQLMGLNDVALGQPDTAQMNAQAFALLASMAVQANSSDQSNYVRFVRDVGRSTLQTLQQRLTFQRTVAIAGVNSKGLVKQESFTGEDLAAVEDVIVEIGNPLQQTAAGRLQIAQLNIEQGFITNPEQLTLVLETGRLDPQTQSARNQLLLIASENEELAKGINPVVSVYDQHALHAKEHAAVLADPDARKDPATVEAIQAHIDAHFDALYTTDPRRLALVGIQPPAPPPMPGMDAAAGGGAPMPEGAPPAEELPGAAVGVEQPELPTNPETGEPPPVAGVDPLAA